MKRRFSSGFATAKSSLKLLDFLVRFVSRQNEHKIARRQPAHSLKRYTVPFFNALPYQGRNEQGTEKDID